MLTMPPSEPASPTILPTLPANRPRLWTPLRLLLIVLLIPALIYVGWRLFPNEADRRVASITPAEAIGPLRDAALRTLNRSGGVRDDGYVYAVDVGQLATFAALAGDRELYDPLRRIILDQLLVRRVPGDPAHGMIAWRFHRPASPADTPAPASELLTVEASGTTEALRAAEALWRGTQAFDDLEDRDTIALIIDAYARHAYDFDGTWMIRNYFNLDPRVYHFSTNSFLVDYDPDLLAELADAFGRPDWQTIADRSAALIDRAATPAGLLHQMIRPEVSTIMPGFAPDGIYSLDGVEQINNVLTVAERCVTTNPELARGVLAFCQRKLGDLRLYYEAQTGQPLPGELGRTPPGPETWAPLLRLAIKLDAPAVRDAALRHVLRGSERLADEPGRDHLYLLGEALLALQYAKPPPPASPRPPRPPLSLHPPRSPTLELILLRVGP